jgi:thymidylate kinase
MTAIIIEGPDRVGKTTQIKRLMSFLAGSKPMEWLHYTSIKGLTPEQQTELFKITFDHMFKLIEKQDAIWFLDRSHLGERVYGNIYRPGIDISYIWDLEKKYHIADREDVFLIVLYDSSFKNLERDDGDSYSTELQMCKKEVENFKAAYYGTSIRKKILLDIKDKNADEVQMEIESFISDCMGARRNPVNSLNAI